jgi:nitrogen-specific signal transduction histidine kinase
MLSTSFESSEEEGGYLHDVSRRSPSADVGSVQDDVERLIEIAARLFSSIERQIHQIEEELVIACGEHVRTFAQTVFKERLISCAQSLDASLQEIALNLEQRANVQDPPPGYRDSPYI